MRLLRARWVLVCMLLYCRLKADDEFPWATVKKVMDVFCPTLEVCGRSMGSNMTPVFVSHDHEDCCSGCSCDESCEETGNCCFSRNSNGTKRIEDRTGGKCMHPRSKYQFEPTLLSSDPVYIIDSPPNDGCIIKGGPGCHGNDILQLLPVSSPSTGNVYYNEHCALCHADANIVTWNAMFICDRHRDIMQELEMYMIDPKQTPCFFSFLEPEGENNSISKDNLCRMKADTSGYTMTKYEKSLLRSLYNVSYEEVVELCFKSNLSLPYYSTEQQLLYDNPFCYIHGGGPGLMKSSCDVMGRSNDPSRLYTALIDYKAFVNVMSVKANPIKKAAIEYVCYKENLKSKGNEIRPPCRPIRCPMSQVFNGNGKCIPLTSMMSLSRRQALEIQLRLSAINQTAYGIMDIANMTISDIESAIDLPAYWRVMFVGYGYNLFHEDADVGEELGQDLLVCLYTKFGSMHVDVAGVKRSLARPVVLKLNDGSQAEFSKHIYRQTLIPTKWGYENDTVGYPIVTDFETEIALWVLYGDGPLSDVNLDLVCWRGVHTTLDFFEFHKKTVISRLHLCQQIELNPDEFTLAAYNRLLVYTKTGAYLYENEFKLVEVGEKVVTAMVCYKDVGFERTLQRSGCLLVRSFIFTSLMVYVVLRAII